MKLFLISQDQNSGWDTYDSAVVIAPDEETARNINPYTGEQMADEDWKGYRNYTWCNSPEHVRVKYLGESVDETPGVICASFNAG